MAEQVQAVMDSMVAPLRDLQERNIFSEDEIKSIVTRRRQSEYLVRRRAVRKADFLRYLQAEMNLEMLRALRTKRTKKNNDFDSTVKKDIGDVHIQQHVHFLFTRALRKFRSDISLHLQYAEFCKSVRAYTKLGRIYAEALQVHPRNTGLWIEAASHEFFREGSVASARVLMQRSLRINPNSQELWLQYFGLEFHHVQKLKGRREVMQLNNDENDEDAPREDAIPTVVFNNAIQAIADDVTFRLKFLDMCRLFPSTDKMKAHIMESIVRDFTNQPEAWIARAAFCANKNRSQEEQAGFVIDRGEEETERAKKQQKVDDAQSPVLSVLREATDTLSSAEMYVRSIQFLRTYKAQVEQTDGMMNEAKACDDFVHDLLGDAKTKIIVSTDLILEEADVLVHEGKLADAIRVLEDFAAFQKNADASIWLQWARLSAGSLDASESASRVLRRALSRFPVHGKDQMVILMELFGALLTEATESNDELSETNFHAELARLFQRMLLLSPGTGPLLDHDFVFGIDSLAVASLQYLKYSMATRGIESTRHVYEQVLYRSSYSGSTTSEMKAMKEFIDECIRFEKAAPKSKKKRQILARLYETAIDLFRDLDSETVDTYMSRRDNDVRYGR